MGLFSRDYKNNNPTQAEKKSIFGVKKLRNQLTEDYGQYSEQHLFAQIKSENWNVKTDEDKIVVLQEIENREAAAHNRPAAKVVQAYGSNYGGYIGGAHRIEIRLMDNQFEDLDTLFHESEHANQSRSHTSNVSFSENDKKLMRIEDMISSDGISSHYNKYGSSLYEVMTSELDAYNTALEKVSSLKNEYKDEGKYQEYLTGRQEYYDGLAVAIDIKYPEKKAALLNTVECAYARNELSESEFSELQAIIVDKEDYDLCEKRVISINETLRQVDLQDKSSLASLSLDRTASSNDVQTADLTTGQTGIPRYQVVDAAQIHNFNNISDNFWNHHGHIKEDYMELASKLPEIQNEYANGKTYAEIKANPELHDTLVAYYSNDKMIQVIQDQNGNYQYQDDGRHRVMAAQELDCHIPVNVINSEEPVIAYYYENQQSISDEVTVVGADKEAKDISQNPSAMNQLSAYMREHTYGRDDFAEYSQDPEWRLLQTEAFPNYEMPLLAQENAQRQLAQYMNEYNYGKDDYAEYSQDSIWRELHAAAFPDHELPPLSDSKEDISSVGKDTTDEVNDGNAKMADVEQGVTEVEIEEIEEIETEEETEKEEEAEGVETGGEVENEGEDNEIEESKFEEVEESEVEDIDSVMIDDVENGEYKDSGYEEDSVMVEDLVSSEGATEMENDSEMIDALGETDNVDNSVSESNDYSASSNGGMSSDGGTDME